MVIGNTGAIRQIATNPKTGFYSFKAHTLCIECMLVNDNFIKQH